MMPFQTPLRGLETRSAPSVGRLRGPSRPPPTRRRITGLLLCALVVLALPTGLRGQASSPLSAEVDASQDARIAEALQRRFERIEALEGVEVEVEAGVVRLSGEALSGTSRRQAVEIAERTEGVATVVDDVAVVTDLEERLRPALESAKERLLEMLSYVPLALVSLAVFVLFFLLARWVRQRKAPFRRLKLNRFASDLTRQAVSALILIAGLLIALEILDATALVGAVLGTAGVFGIAVGFAFRDLAENYISSVLLSLRQPFAPNDHVVIDGKEGKVMRLTSRATILMTLDGNHLRIPNAQVFKGTVLNYSRNPLRRFDFGVGVGTNEDPVEAQRLGVDILRGMGGVLDDPEPMALIRGLGDSSYDLGFFGWVDQRKHDFSKVRGEAIRQVKECLESAGMDLPEPIYRVRLTDAGGSLVQMPGAAGAGASGKPKAADSAGSKQQTSTRETAEAPVDTSVDTAVDEQIASERRDTGDGDLLDETRQQE